MQEAIIEKIPKALLASLILWSIGLLIGSWMFLGTVILPLIPWSAVGAYMIFLTIEYFSWVILNYSGIIFAITGIGITKDSISDKEIEYELEKENTIDSQSS